MTRIRIGMWTVKDRLTGFQLGRRTPWGIGLKTIPNVFWERIYLHFVHVLRLGIKSNKIINLAEEIQCSRDHSIQVMACLLLATYNQIYSENL